MLSFGINFRVYGMKTHIIKTIEAIEAQAGYLKEEILEHTQKAQAGNIAVLIEFLNGATLDEKIASLEHFIVANTYKENNWHKSNTANNLGITSARLDRIIRRYDLKRNGDIKAVQ